MYWVELTDIRGFKTYINLAIVTEILRKIDKEETVVLLANADYEDGVACKDFSLVKETPEEIFAKPCLLRS